MATNWWRVVTNPSYLTDDELHAIKDTVNLVLSLTPSDPTAIPESITFCQVIGVMRRVWGTPLRYSYINQWINLNEAGNEPIDWNACGRDHARNLATLRRAAGLANSAWPVGSSEGAQSQPIAGQISDRVRDFLERETYVFFRTHRYFFHHPGTDIYVVQVFEKNAWGIRFFIRGIINGVMRTLISVPALAHLSLDLTTIVPSIKRARSMLEVDEY